MKRAKSAICVIMMMFVISACEGRTSKDSAVSMREQEEIPGEAEETATHAPSAVASATYTIRVSVHPPEGMHNRNCGVISW